MEWMKNLERVIYYIEHNLDKEISFSETVRITCCSSCYFQRIFSYVFGISLSEYIRLRKMTQAAYDLQRTNSKVIDIALKYGYISHFIPFFIFVKIISNNILIFFFYFVRFY